MLHQVAPERLHPVTPYLLQRLFVPVSISHCHFKMQPQVVELLTNGSLLPMDLPGQILPVPLLPDLPETKQQLRSIVAK
jgi:hypothetical protein